LEQVDIVVIGAGVIGLAVSAELSVYGRSLYCIERHNSFGQETSSRNSEVIHAGIYYPKESLKARSCIEGNKLLYELCIKNKIPHRQTQKLIVATSDAEIADLKDLFKKGTDNGVSGLRLIDKKEISRIEPEVKAAAALVSPSTGIIDSHRFMQFLVSRMKDNNAEVIYNSEVAKIQKTGSNYKITIKEQKSEEFSFESRIVINSAGLESDTIASKVGIDIESKGYRLKYCKGQYFRVIDSLKSKMVNRLIYPVPKPKSAGLGIHATPDLAGSLRLGPDDKYIGRDQINFDVDINQRDKFLDSARNFLPFLEKGDLIPDTSGIRPKLQGEGEDFRDFVVKEETDSGFPGFVNLVGIESPGLTACLSIAKYTKKLINHLL